MIITILAVTVETVQSTKGAPYKKMEVAFKDSTGAVKGKKIVSLYAKDIFPILEQAVSGEVFDVTTVKEGEFWVWKAIVKAGAPAAAVSSGGYSAAPAAKGGSTYASADERAKTQVYIVRQNGLTNAVALAAAVGDKKATPESIIKVAAQFAAFVLDTHFDDGVVGELKDDAEEIY